MTETANAALALPRQGLPGQRTRKSICGSVIVDGQNLLVTVHCFRLVAGLFVRLGQQDQHERVFLVGLLVGLLQLGEGGFVVAAIQRYVIGEPPSRWAWRTAWRKLTAACGLGVSGHMTYRITL